MHSDLTLLERYHQQRDAGAFQSLVKLHGGMVFATARRITCDPALAEEVAQDTFLALARQGRHVRESVPAWLHHVARQKACNVVRGEARRRQREHAAVVEAEAHGPEEGSWREVEPWVDEALAELPEAERTLIIEHFLEQRPQREIAVRHGLNQSTVSRRIEGGLEQLRAGLRRRGVACGLGLGALLATGTAEAAPATLNASLGKLAASGIGTGTAGTAASLLTLASLKLVLLVAALLVTGAVGYDLASKNSHLARWFGPVATAKSGGGASLKTQETVGVRAPALQEQRWAAEAREIWARVPKFSLRDFSVAEEKFTQTKDRNTRFAILRSIGINLPEASFDRLLQRYESSPKKRAYDLWQSVMEEWVKLYPREVVAWAYHLGVLSRKEGRTTVGSVLDEVDGVLEKASAAATRSDPGAWAAFIAASPDPRLAAHDQFWRQVAADPALIWTKGAEIELGKANIQSAAIEAIRRETPERALQVIESCPQASCRERSILGLAARLEPEQLVRLAGTDFAANAPLANFLRAMAGDAAASFSDAAAFALKPNSPIPAAYNADYAGWTAECMEKVYAQWVKSDPDAALRQAAKEPGLLEHFMTVAAEGLSERAIFDSLADATAGQRDGAIAAFLNAQAGGRPEETLQRIMQSDLISDQVSESKTVLENWARFGSADAAAGWVRALPPGGNRAELAAAIVPQWAESEPEAAVVFMREEGLRMDKGSDCLPLAFSIRRLEDSRLTPLLETFRQDEDYNRMVVLLAGYRLPSEPAAAFQFLAAHANEGWQPALVTETLRWLGGTDSRTEAYAQALPDADLSSVPAPLLAKLGDKYAEFLTRQGKASQVLDWTLRLPAAAAPEVRSAAVSRVAAVDPAQGPAIAQWISRATISGDERQALLQVLAASPAQASAR